MDMSINDYLFNPQGKGAIQPGLRLIKEEYDSRYETLLGAHEEFETNIYSDGKNQFYIHVKLPSETYTTVEYDIVVRLTKGLDGFNNTIDNWNFSVVSNSPSFVFTYANVFKKNNLLIKDLAFVVDKKAYTMPPKIRNPYFMLGPEKNLYYVFKYIKGHFNEVSLLNELSSPFNLRKLKEELNDIGTILEQIEVEKTKTSMDKKKAKAEQKKLAIIERHKAMLEARREKMEYNKSLNDKQEHTLQDIKSIKPVSRIKPHVKIRPIKKQ